MNIADKLRQVMKQPAELHGQVIAGMNWICHECAEKRGSRLPAGHIATFHAGWCDAGQHEAFVTEPRDFRPRPDRPGAEALATMNKAECGV